MAITVVSASIFQTKVGTEHQFVRVDSSGVYQFTVSAQSHVLGDVAHFAMRTVPLSGEALQTIYQPTLANCYSEPIWVSPPIVSPYQTEFTVQVTSSGVTGSGVGSNGPPYAWRVDKIN